MSEQIKPDYYQNTFPDGRVWDVIDIAAAMKLPFTLSLALKYFRKKGNWEKQVEDLHKAVECINREIEYITNANVTIDELPF